MTKKERKAYMQQRAAAARARREAMEMERAAVTARAIRASVEAAKDQKAVSMEEFLEQMDRTG